MDRPERAVAVLHGVDDDAHADEILHVVELLALHDHLLVHGPVVLRSTLDLGFDVHVGEAVLHLREHRCEELLPLGGPTRHHLLDLRVALGVQDVEREILELPLHVGDAEPMRERRVDVERLLGDPLLLRGRERTDRPHVVEPVRELDQEDADVLRHRDEHLAQGGGLLRLPRVEVEAIELGDTVDDAGDLGPEQLLEVLDRHHGVLDRVVQQRGRDRHVVEPELGEDHRDAQRVIDVGLAGPSHLLGVRLTRDLVGLLDERRVGPAVPLLELGEQRREGVVDVVTAPRAWETRSTLGTQVERAHLPHHCRREKVATAR